MTDALSQSKDKDHFTYQNYLLLWLDPNLDESDDNYCNISGQLRQIIDTIIPYTDINECIDFLTNTIDKNIFMIIPAAAYQQLVPLIHDVSQLYSIYVLRDDDINHDLTAEKFRKVKKVSYSIDDICKLLHHDIKQCDHNSFPISIISPNDFIKPNLNELPPTFMYSQILKEILLDINPDANTKEDLIHFWYELYCDNELQLEKIGEFERDYHPNSAIRWYTRENFTYSILNRALRTLDVEIIIKMSFFMRDLLQQIKQRHDEHALNPVRKTVYRGQGVFNDEFEKLRNGKGGLLSFNSFLSTSTDPEVSKIFCPIPPQDPNMTAVLFKIDLDSTSMCIPFAPLNATVTNFVDEQEILISMHSVFRIGEVTKIDQDLWYVELASTNDHDKELDQLTEYIRQEIGEASGWYRLGQLMIKIGHFNKAEEIYRMLFEHTSTDDSTTVALLFNQLAITKHSRGEFKEALMFYYKRAEIQKNSVFLYPSELGTTYSNIASTYVDLGQHSEALHYYIEALNITQKFLPPNSSDLAVIYDNIGVLHRRNGNYQQALNFYEKVLAIYKKNLPPNHPDLARTYNNIAVVCYHLEKYPQSLDFHLKTLQIEEKSLVPNHRNLGVTCCAIGQVYKEMKDYSTAFTYYERARQVFDKSLLPNDPLWTTIYNSLGSLYDSKQDYSKARAFFYKTMDIAQKTLSSNHPDLVKIYNNIAGTYEESGEYSNALKFYEKACKVGEESLSADHPDLAMLYNNTAGLYYRMGNYPQALSLFQHALSIFRSVYPENHRYVQNCQQGIAQAQNQLSFPIHLL